MSKFYYVYFLIVASVSVSRFSYFASTTLNPETQGWLFALIVCACAFYGAFLGIEALSRFSAFCFVLLGLAVVSVILCNFDTFREINLYPIITFSKFDLIKNAVVYASNTSEIAMFLAIFPKVNGRCERTYIRSVCLSFLTAHLKDLMYFIFLFGLWAFLLRQLQRFTVQVPVSAKNRKEALFLHLRLLFL